MSSLFSTPEVPQEDPEIARQRKLEQERAESGRIRATQDQLQQETLIRNRGFGLGSLIRVGRGRRGLTSLLGAG